MREAVFPSPLIGRTAVVSLVAKSNTLIINLHTGRTVVSSSASKHNKLNEYSTKDSSSSKFALCNWPSLLFIDALYSCSESSVKSPSSPPCASQLPYERLTIFSIDVTFYTSPVSRLCAPNSLISGYANVVEMTPSLGKKLDHLVWLLFVSLSYLQ